MSRLKVRWVAGSFASFSRSASAVDGGGQTGESWWVMVVSRSHQAWSSSWAWCNFGRPVFLQKGTCFHHPWQCSVWYGCCHATFPNLLWKPQANEVTYTAVMGVCGMSGEWQRVLELLNLGYMFTWVSQHLPTPQRLVFESILTPPGQIGGGPDFFETHRTLLRMAAFEGKLVSYQFLEGCVCSMALWCLWLWCPSWGCNAIR